MPPLPVLAPAPLALWGGVECTVNRVGDRYLDQMEQSGHTRRLDDLNLFAELGLRGLRFPVLWERVAPRGLDTADWAWTDAALGRLRRLEIEPVVGLVHHGSGPAHTSLLDPEFPAQMAEYARAVARRYPWVTRYTPINEPLTTARFSGLYGHWYPHGKDSLLFARMLLTQCHAVQRAMEAIREVTPEAQLVQTEDMGKTYSTPTLSYQADFDNERRWLSFDLLCGRVVPGHPMHHFLCWLGVEDNELRSFAERPCPPDVLGINYYVTSERFLDERLERYPGIAPGGNGRSDYVDVEAVRVRAEGLVGLGALLGEAWARYRRPLAVTEVHLGAPVEEQMRWLAEMWNEAGAAQQTGVDVRAVTAWSLLGAYDWNSLVTRPEGHYEPGVFARGADGPEPTLLASLLRDLAQTGGSRQTAHRSVLSAPGWWRRPERLLYPPVGHSGV